MKIEELWKLIPSANCKGLCQESCGPIFMSPAEEQILKEFCEKNGLKYHTIEERFQFNTEHDLHCPYLQEGKCSVYEVRPSICRMWGATQGMPCVFGCKPDDVLTDNKAGVILRKADEC